MLFEQFQLEYSEIVAIIRYTNLYYSDIIHWRNVGKKNVDFRISFFSPGPYFAFQYLHTYIYVYYNPELI